MHCVQKRIGEADSDSMSIPACIRCRSNIGDADTVSPLAGILCMQKQFRQRRFRVCHDNTGIPHSHICNYNASAEICACKPMGYLQTIFLQGGGSPQLYYHDCSGRIPVHTTRAPPVGFELETNGFEFHAIANLDKTSLKLYFHCTD